MHTGTLPISHTPTCVIAICKYPPPPPPKNTHGGKGTPHYYVCKQHACSIALGRTPHTDAWLKAPAPPPSRLPASFGRSRDTPSHRTAQHRVPTAVQAGWQCAAWQQGCVCGPGRGPLSRFARVIVAGQPANGPALHSRGPRPGGTPRGQRGCWRSPRSAGPGRPAGVGWGARGRGRRQAVGKGGGAGFGPQGRARAGWGWGAGAAPASGRRELARRRAPLIGGRVHCVLGRSGTRKCGAAHCAMQDFPVCPARLCSSCKQPARAWHAQASGPAAHL